MPIYTYKCPVHDEFEEEHSIKDKLEFCPHCQKEHPSDPPQLVIRLISSGSTFVLNGGGWAKDNYK